MRRPSPFIRRAGELDIKMTPMIDVVFLLLVFFIWTASFRIVEHALPGKLLAATGSEPSDLDEPPPPEADFEVVVRVRWTGDRPAWELNGVPLTSLEEVRARLKSIALLNRDAPVILHPDQAVPIGDAIDVYDIARLAGFEAISFATAEEIGS